MIKPKHYRFQDDFHLLSFRAGFRSAPHASQIQSLQDGQWLCLPQVGQTILPPEILLIACPPFPCECNPAPLTKSTVGWIEIVHIQGAAVAARPLGLDHFKPPFSCGVYDPCEALHPAGTDAYSEPRHARFALCRRGRTFKDVAHAPRRATRED